MTLHIPDVSSNNLHPIDWDAVQASGVAGAMVKLGEGTYYRSDTFDADWAALKQRNMLRGFYWFTKPGEGTVQADAYHCISCLPSDLQPGDVYALDIETPIDNSLGNFDFAGWAWTWLQIVESHLGWPGLIYSYPYYVETRLNDGRLAASYKLWLAALDPTCPTSCGRWNTITLWQSTWTAQIPGITGNVDCSTYFLDEAHFRSLGKPDPRPFGDHVLITPQHMRSGPAVFPVTGPLLPAGTRLKQIAGFTPHWCKYQTETGAAGWLMDKNVQAG